MIIFDDFKKIKELALNNELFQLEFLTGIIFVGIVMYIVFFGLRYSKIRDIFTIHNHTSPQNWLDFIKTGIEAPILSGNGISMIRVYFALPLAILTFFFYRETVISSVLLHFYILLFATDALDGAVARSLNDVSNFGKVLDPLADKILDLPILLIVCYFFGNEWFVVLAGMICIFDIIGQKIRTKTSNPGANLIGKLKTVFKIITIYVLSLTRFDVYLDFGLILLLISLLLTTWSFGLKLYNRK